MMQVVAVWRCLFFFFLVVVTQMPAAAAARAQSAEGFVGGLNAEPREFPWFTAVFQNGVFQCSGALIASRHVVTASHCVPEEDDEDDAEVSVRVGYWCREKDNCGQSFETALVRRVHRHNNDESGHLVLLVLDRRLRLPPAVPYLGPLFHPSQKSLLKRPELYLVGVGRRHDDDDISQHVRKWGVTYIRDTECQKTMHRPVLEESVVCSVVKDVGSACEGDLGAPVIVRGRKMLQNRHVILALHLGGGTNNTTTTHCSTTLPTDQVQFHFRMQDAANLILSVVCDREAPEDWCVSEQHTLAPTVAPFSSVAAAAFPPNVNATTTRTSPQQQQHHATAQYHSYISSETVLQEKDGIFSDNGKYFCTLESDGNLVGYEMRRNGQSPQRFWSSGTSSGTTSPFRLVLFHNGNLVLYDGNDRLVWETGTAGTGPSHLYLQDDRNIVLYNAHGHTWASWTPTPTTRHDDHISSGVHLHVGDRIVSSNGQYYCTLESDGTLVGYEVANGRQFWSSSSGPLQRGFPPFRMVLQHDGNLVIWDRENKPVWNTHTSGKGESHLYMQNDRNIVLLHASGESWASGTPISTQANHHSSGGFDLV